MSNLKRVSRRVGPAAKAQSLKGTVRVESAEGLLPEFQRRVAAAFAEASAAHRSRRRK